MGDRDAKLFKLPRDQGARTDQGHARAEFEEAEDIRARHPAEENVADDRDLKAGDRAFPRPDRVKIEQRLGRMLVRAVAGVDDARAEPLGQKLRRAGRTVPQDDEIGVVGLQNFRACP